MEEKRYLKWYNMVGYGSGANRKLKEERNQKKWVRKEWKSWKTKLRMTKKSKDWVRKD